MRFVLINAIREGMVNGKTLYGRNEEVLLRVGTILNPYYIRRISEMGYKGVYVIDALGEDVVYHEIVSQELRLDTVVRIKNIFLTAEKKQHKQTMHLQKEGLNEMIGKLIEEVLNNRDLMLNMIDLKVFDEYTYYHSVNVAVISLVIAVAVGMVQEDLYKLALAALLHDVGKITIPREIHDKPGKLTSEEFEVMKTHSDEGFRFLKEVYCVPLHTYMAVKLHHERFDGTGYPLGLKETEIPLFARIIAVADVFDALTSVRVYRKAMSPSEAVEFMMSHSGTMFDPEITSIFLRKVAPYPPGTLVKLSDGRIALVVETYENFGLRPLVKVVKEEEIVDEPYYLNLKEDYQTLNLTIEDICSEEAMHATFSEESA